MHRARAVAAALLAALPCSLLRAAGAPEGTKGKNAEPAWEAVWADARADAGIRTLIGAVSAERMKKHLFHLSKDPLPFRKLNLTLPGHDGSFVKAGYGATVLNTGSSPYGDPNYHAEGDTPERSDVENAALTVRATLAAMLTPAQQRALDRALSRRFTVIYHGESEIPPDRIDELGQLDGGCIIRWELHRDCVFWFTATCGEYRALLGASRRRATFLLLLGTWIDAWTSEGWVA